MALDGFTLSLIKQELSSAIGSRVEKVHQPSRDEIVLVLRSRSGSSRLLISANANAPKIHFTAYPPENPPKPPMFCMLMRKHLTNAVISGVRQEGLERALLIDLDGTDEIGTPVKLTLAVEIMAQYSNIILIRSDGIILDAVKRVDSEKSSLRQLLPGMIYQLPPKQDKINLFDASASEIASSLPECTGKTAHQALLSRVAGLSPIVCREIVYRAVGDDKRAEILSDNDIERLAAEIKNLQAFSDPRPSAVFDVSGKPIDFTFFVPKQYGGAAAIKQYDSFSQLLDDFYYERSRINRAKQISSDLQKTLSSLIARTARRLDIQQRELEKSIDRERLRINAELISANMFRLSKGMPYYEVLDYYSGETVRIKADPALSPNDNSQRYYKEYRKAKNAQEVLTRLIEEGEEELSYLESVRDALNRAEGAAEITEIRNELMHEGFIRNKSKDSKAGKVRPLSPDTFISSDGFTILVGKNNEMNDRLSFKIASKGDMWLHTQKFAGSHTVIVTQGRDIPDQTLLEAAKIAAYNSDARHSSGVPVDYTPVRNLKKPPGAKPGKVIYHTYNTVYVTPDKETVLTLREKKA